MNKFSLGVAIVALVVAVGAFLYNPVQPVPPVGGYTSDNWGVGGNLTVAGTSVLTGTTTLSGTVNLAKSIATSPSYIKTSSTYCTKIVPSTSAASLTITTSTSCN